MSYKTTRNVGKLLPDAQKCGARWAVILGDEAAQGQAQVKNLISGEQTEMVLAGLADRMK